MEKGKMKILGLKNSILDALLMIVLACTFLIVLLIIGKSRHIPILSFMRDPFFTMNAPFYTGISSNIGFLFWCSTAVICLYSYIIIKNKSYNRNIELFILFSGILTLYLALDDFFMLHEIFRDYLYVPEKLTYAIYFILTLSYLIRFRKVLLKSDYFILFFITLFILGLSVAVDVLTPKICSIITFASSNKIAAILTFIEDGSKLMGILCWFRFFTKFCKKAVVDTITMFSKDVIYSKRTNMENSI